MNFRYRDVGWRKKSMLDELFIVIVLYIVYKILKTKSR